jgi:hypothetical protein
MVKSNLCWLHSQNESDCLFDSGGYFLVKGMEKVYFCGFYFLVPLFVNVSYFYLKNKPDTVRMKNRWGITLLATRHIGTRVWC